MDMSLIAFSAIIVSNACFSMGFGMLDVIPHKKHTVFMLCSNFMILLESVVCTSLYYLVYNFLLVPFECTDLSMFLLTTMALLVVFLGMTILKKASKENYYHYEKNFLFVVHTVVLMGLALSCNLQLDYVYLLFYIAMQFLGMFAVNIIFFALNRRINNRTIPDQVRALSPQLVVMAVLALIGYLLTGLIV